jgi:hypothetical protein
MTANAASSAKLLRMGEGDQPTIGSLSDSDEFHGPAVLLDGFARACERFRIAEDARLDSHETFIPIFEALNWAVSLEDHMRIQREQPLSGDLVRGFRCVRNRVHHQWAAALEPIDIPTPTILFQFPWWHWKPLDRLPEPSPGHQKEDEDKAYVAKLAGKPVGDALQALQSVFDQRIKL